MQVCVLDAVWAPEGLSATTQAICGEEALAADSHQ